MKPELSELRKWLQTLLKKQNRARLALVLGCIAMALILLSELVPAKAPAAPQAVSPEEGTYKTQLEQQKSLLLSQIGTLTEQIGGLDNDIVNKQDEINQKQQEVDQKQA